MEHDIDTKYVKQLTNSLINCLHLNFNKEINYFYNSSIIIFLDYDALISYAITRNNDKILKLLCETKIPKPPLIDKKFHYLFNIDMLVDKNKAFLRSLTANKFGFADYLLRLGAKIHFEDDCSIRYACNNQKDEVINYLINTGEFDESNIYRNIFYSFLNKKYISAKVLFSFLFHFYILMVSDSNFITSAENNFNHMNDAYIVFFYSRSLTEFRSIRKKIILKALEFYLLLGLVENGTLNFIIYSYLKNECFQLLMDMVNVFHETHRNPNPVIEHRKDTKSKSRDLNKRRYQLINFMQNSDYWKELVVPPIINLIYITLENPPHK